MCTTKDQIISTIKNRILVEYRKHKNLDWANIAAHKIWSEHMQDFSELITAVHRINEKQKKILINQDINESEVNTY